ncbi:hypothetical protein [Acinetobacter baumannii]|uniref:hypothetical protein n=1 Tax=Acinetobacter baumannii TaxID=470 RepID=UPI0029406776|nr:hypothetical protein [Acinetobacter baumannii]MDV4308926.1 hypothetical protein [Acinetobacter baumannii]
MDKCREEFEKWLDDNNMFMNIERRFDQESNTYDYCAIRWIWESWQHQQAKVEELQRRNQMLNDNIKEQGQKLVYQNEVIETQAEKLLGLRDEKAELQKRGKFLEQELGAWKGKSIAAMVNGMCKQCGKEPLQAIVSDKECYALLHCFGCGADKYELIGEQALKGEGQ